MRKLTEEEVVNAIGARLDLAYMNYDADWRISSIIMDKMIEVNQQDALDATRYRWLREGDNDELVLKQLETDCWYLPRLERLDVAIDAYTKDIQDETAKPKY